MASEGAPNTPAREGENRIDRVLRVIAVPGCHDPAGRGLAPRRRVLPAGNEPPPYLGGLAASDCRDESNLGERVVGALLGWGEHQADPIVIGERALNAEHTLAVGGREPERNGVHLEFGRERFGISADALREDALGAMPAGVAHERVHYSRILGPRRHARGRTGDLPPRVDRPCRS